MRASHKTVDRLLSGFPDPGWGALLWKVAEVILRSTSSSPFSSASSSSSPSSSFFYFCPRSGVGGGVAREGGRGHAGEDHIKIIIIIITSFIIITIMYSQIRGWGTLLGRFNRGHDMFGIILKFGNICQLKTKQKGPIYQILLSVTLSWGKCFCWYTKDSGIFFLFLSLQCGVCM